MPFFRNIGFSLPKKVISLKNSPSPAKSTSVVLASQRKNSCLFTWTSLIFSHVRDGRQQINKSCVCEIFFVPFEKHGTYYEEAWKKFVKPRQFESCWGGRRGGKKPASAHTGVFFYRPMKLLSRSITVFLLYEYTLWMEFKTFYGQKSHLDMQLIAA